MSHDVCPIIRPYLLSVMSTHDAGLLDADEQWTLEALEAELPLLSIDPARVRLRAFILIEDMLDSLRVSYERYRQPHQTIVELRLDERSWEGLTRTLDNLNALHRELGIEIVEMRLLGVNAQQMEDHLLDGNERSAVSMALVISQTEHQRLGQRALTGVRLHVAVGYAREAITALRPHLGNAAAPLHGLTLNYIRVQSLLHGDTGWISHTLPVIKKAAAVRL